MTSSTQTDTILLGLGAHPKIVQEVIVPHIEAAVSAAIDTKMGGDNKKTWADLLRENNSNRDKDMVDKIEKVVKTNTTDMIQKKKILLSIMLIIV